MSRFRLHSALFTHVSLTTVALWILLKFVPSWFQFVVVDAEAFTERCRRLFLQVSFRRHSQPSSDCDDHCYCYLYCTDRSGELRRRWQEGAEAAEACSVTVRPITSATKARAANDGRGGRAEQPAVQRHIEPERVIRRRTKPAARRGQRRPWAAAARGLLRPVLEMTRSRIPSPSDRGRTGRKKSVSALKPEAH